MNGTERRMVADALTPFADGLTLDPSECGCGCGDCQFLWGGVVLEAADVERLEDALRAVGYEIREIQR